MSVVNLSAIECLRVIAGTSEIDNTPLRVFSEDATSFLAEVSNALLHDGVARSMPDVVSFAYWCRKGNLQRQREEHASALGFDARLGRGLALHIAPSNVPVNFAFTYAFSLLAGNATIVRVSSKQFAQVDAIVRILSKVLERYPAVKARTAFVAYDSSSDGSERLSALADVRVIWGGDATVATIKALPTMPRCVDMAFADRYSIAMIGASAINEASDEALARLAQDFYNDTYLMDQNACSSPRTILWVGDGDDNGVTEAKKRFWKAVDTYAAKRYELQPAVVMDKYVKECGDFMRGAIVSAEVPDGVLTVAELDESEPLSTELRGQGGYFYERTVSGLADVGKDITERYQTITYFGLDASEICDEIVVAGLRGVDRIVPIGQAMDVGLIWDGYDLISMMSRVVDVR